MRCTCDQARRETLEAVLAEVDRLERRWTREARSGDAHYAGMANGARDIAAALRRKVNPREERN